MVTEETSIVNANELSAEKRKFINLNKNSRLLDKRVPILHGIYDFREGDFDLELERLVVEKADFSFVDEISESEDEQQASTLNISRDFSLSNSPNIDVIKSLKEKAAFMDKRHKRKRCELKFYFNR
jgi:hypothetical protein